MFIPFPALRLLQFDAVHELDGILKFRRYSLLCILRQTIIQTVYPYIPIQARDCPYGMEWKTLFYQITNVYMRVYTGQYGYTVVYRFV